MRKLMLFAIGFSAACVLGAYFTLPLAILAALALGVSAVLAVACMQWRSCRMYAVLTLGLGIGLCWFTAYDHILLTAIKDADGNILDTTITVSDYSYATDYGSAVDGSILLEGKEYHVRAYLEGDKTFVPGETVTGKFRYRVTTEGGSQDPTYHRSEGVFLLLYQEEKVSIMPSLDIDVKFLPALWRAQLLQRMEELFPDDTAGFAMALLLGERYGIDYETSTAFKVSGISHIIAVSGLHVAILFGLIYFVSGRRRFLTALIGIPVVILFAAVVGFTPSITRAAIMQILMMLAMLFEREYDPPTALAFAALVILAVNPLAITSVSFQLSFGCMIGIFLFSGRIRQWLQDEKRIGSGKGKGFVPMLKRWFTSSVSVTLGATVVTTPLVAYYFGTVSLIGILTNLLTLWVITFIFYGIMLCCILGSVSLVIGQGIAAVISWPIRYVVGTAKLLSAFPLAAVYTESVYIVIWLVGCYGILTAYLLMKKKPALVLSCVTVITLFAALVLSWTEPLLDECRVTVLDVGQGQSILLQSQGKTFLVDCGGSDNEDAADKAAETLLSQGISRLDGIIVTHYDADHAGGVENLLSRMDTDLLLLPAVADEDNVGLTLAAAAGEGSHYVNENLELTFGEAKLTVVAPISYNSGNESSLCVLFQTEKCDILITGDRGELGEAMLLRQIELPQIELLIVGHHGSKYSTTDSLLSVIQPETAIISVGRDNYYGHPAQETLDRLAAIGCIVYRTDTGGTIIYRR